jgi:hypothetical protein
MVQRGPGGQLISGQVYIADLRNPHSVEGAWQSRDQDIMTADQHAMRFEPEGICSNGSTCRPEAGDKPSSTDSHEENLVGFESRLG